MFPLALLAHFLCCRFFVGRMLVDLSQKMQLDDQLLELKSLLTSKSRCCDTPLTPRAVLEKCPWLRGASPLGKGVEPGATSMKRSAQDD